MLGLAARPTKFARASASWDIQYATVGPKVLRDHATSSAETTAMKPLPSSLAFLATALALSTAHAEVLQVPEGGKPVLLGKHRVLCGQPADGWVLSGDRLQIRPPTTVGAFNRSFQALIADDPAGCGHSQTTMTVLATGRWPDIDHTSVSFFPDEGRVELKGDGLEG